MHGLSNRAIFNDLEQPQAHISRSGHCLTQNISEMAKDTTIVTMESEYEIVCDLSNGAISNDLERTLTLFSRSHHSLTLNISKTATDTAIVTIEDE